MFVYLVLKVVPPIWPGLLHATFLLQNSVLN